MDQISTLLLNNIAHFLQSLSDLYQFSLGKVVCLIWFIYLKKIENTVTIVKCSGGVMQRICFTLYLLMDIIRKTDEHPPIVQSDLKSTVSQLKAGHSCVSQWSQPKHKPTWEWIKQDSINLFEMD